MRDSTPPPGFCENLERLFGLDFQPTPFIENDELCGTLRVRGAECGPWSDDLWAEYRAYDSILAHDADGRVHRFIRTLVVLVKRKQRDPATGAASYECLTGHVEWPDGSITKRRHAHSLSEKFRWRKGFIWQDSFTTWRPDARRAIYEELGIPLTGIELNPMRRIRQYVDHRSADASRPGVSTHNLILEIEYLLPRRHWRDEYREDWQEQGNRVKTIVHTWVPDTPNE